MCTILYSYYSSNNKPIGLIDALYNYYKDGIKFEHNYYLTIIYEDYMNSTEKLTIWLSYVSYPVTTAVFFERALRKNYNVITCGPVITDEVIKRWNLENMKLEVKPLDLPLDPDVDILEIYNQAPKEIKPDIFLWIESVNGNYPKNIKDLNIPTACYFVDSHLNLPMHLEWGKNFDFVFIAQREYIPEFIKAGIQNVFWLPLACDKELLKSNGEQKTHNLGFVGSISGNKRRELLLAQLIKNFNLYYERCFWDEMARVFAESKIVFNNAVKDDLNMRVFEVMSTGSFLLTDFAKNSGQEELFVRNEDLAVYEDSFISNTAQFYLENDELREIIAKRGMELVHNAHTYFHRAEELLNVVLGKNETTPTAKQWRKRSLENISVSDNDINNLKRSFVIPVLDYSPASPFNINTLLKSLENIGGKVIVIFNNEEVANEMKNHPRIDYYTIMKKNVGVSRAWNIGLHMSQTPITFILNADLTITKETVETLEQNLIQLPEAAIVGPQGSYFNFHQSKDLMYLDKGTFNEPTEVDAVSGFLFAVKTKYFHNGTLIFENKFTPCYFEEWDTGLQIKKANLKSWAVPCKGYEHEWSGSIRALRTIKYLDKEETAGQILERNKKIFWQKWKLIDEEIKMNGRDTILNSLLLDKFSVHADNLISENKVDEAINIYNLLLKEYPKEKSILTNLGVLNYYQGNIDIAKEYFQTSLSIDPDYVIAKENLDMILNEGKLEDIQ